MSIKNIPTHEKKIPELRMILEELWTQIEMVSDNIWKFDHDYKSEYFDHVNEYKKAPNGTEGGQSAVYLRECQKEISEMNHITEHLAYCDTLTLMEIVTYRLFRT